MEVVDIFCVRCVWGKNIQINKKIVHMGGGLGNQMINYTIYIAANCSVEK